MIAHEIAGWRLRAFQSGDEAECLLVHDDCVGEFIWFREWPTPPQSFNRQGRRITWVAEVEQAGIVGFLTLNTKQAYVEYLLVEPDWRLCGVGRGLIETAREAAGKPLTLSVDVENTRARNAYAAMGWRPIAFVSEGDRRVVRMRSA